MSLVSVKFLVFLIIDTAILYSFPIKARKYILLLSSFFFYYQFGPKKLAAFILQMMVCYVFAKILTKYKSRVLFIIALGTICMPLFLLKYFDFFVNQTFGMDVVFPWSYVEPVGISFFTFKMISYLVDHYRDQCQINHSVFDYLLYVCFWPTILSGPIDRPEEMLAQFRGRLCFKADHIYIGLCWILYGYFQKMLIADKLAIIVGSIYQDCSSAGGFSIFMASIFYSLQIYFDFCGYSYIACGAGRLFGINCMQNFAQPYFAKSIKEFWRRWHISLSCWLRDYIYIPLGGQHKKNRNFLLVFLISGLWHGVGWNFIFWGLLHGFYQIVENTVLKS